MKCPLCNQRKSRRYCPAKNAQICAQCCGAKRILEIDCPESCEFLQVGRNHESQSQRVRHLFSADPATMEKRRRVYAEYRDVVLHLEALLAEERRSDRNLKDKDVVEALDLLLATLRTEEKGIIYEHTSNAPAIDGLMRRLKGVLDHHFNPPEEGAERLKVSQAIECVEVIRGLAAGYANAGPSELTYIEFLARLIPRPERETQQGSSIIIPGR